MERRLEGEGALVTGATSGIGRAVAIRLAAEGAAVVVTGRSAERGAAVVAEAAAAGGRNVSFVPADLAVAAEIDGLVARAVAALGRLSILVHCATTLGPRVTGPLAGIDTDELAAYLGSDVAGPVRLLREAMPHLRAARGSIVVVSSRAARVGTPGQAAYTAAKGALAALARAIAVEEAPHGVRCNVVSPGYVLNDRRDGDLDSDPARRARLEAMHLTRLATGADVAAAVAFLASRDAEVITGIDLPVDGGSTIARAATFG